MKLKNSNIGKAQLRREQFNRSQNKSQVKGKKSLSKRIIAERVGGITAINIDKEQERVFARVQAEDLYLQIVYHIRFYKSSRPASFDENKIKDFVIKIRDLGNQFEAREIDANDYLKGLESIDNEITSLIENWEDVKELNS